MLIESSDGTEAVRNTWRSRWLVRHVLSELPVLDGICKCHKQHEIFFYSTRSAVTLLVGTAVMMANIFHLQAGDPMFLKALKMAAGMSVGMASGAVFHNFMVFLRKKRT